MDERAARAELGVPPEAPINEIRAAFVERALLLDRAGKRLALDRLVSAYRVLAPNHTAADGRPGRDWGLVIAVAAAAVGFLLAGFVGVEAVAHRLPSGHASPSGRVAGTTLPATGAPATSAPAPTSAAIGDPSRLVLAATDLGPDFEQVHSGGATLGSLSAGARGWDAVYRSRTTSSLVESIAVQYPSPEAAGQAASVLSGQTDPRTVRTVDTAGSVLIMIVVSPAGPEGTALAQRARQAQLNRVASAG